MTAALALLHALLLPDTEAACTPRAWAFCHCRLCVKCPPSHRRSSSLLVVRPGNSCASMAASCCCRSCAGPQLKCHLRGQCMSLTALLSKGF